MEVSTGQVKIILKKASIKIIIHIITNQLFSDDYEFFLLGTARQRTISRDATIKLVATI